MKYTVRMAVDCRVDIEVEANSTEEAFEKAKEEFMDVEIGDNLEFVDARPVNCTSDEGELTDYE